MNTDYAKKIKGKLTAEEYLLLQALQGSAEECMRGKSTALITAETGKSAAEVRGIARRLMEQGLVQEHRITENNGGVYYSLTRCGNRILHC